jgi:homoserine dehydrogenase|tara:strand:- start:4573 stop:4893 length:321 start_codon:yes stop_codon:yes gene_type:complete
MSGFKPAMCSHILKEIFPETEVNGRHIGAYKRRLIKEEDVLIPNKPTMGKNAAVRLMEQLVSTEDKFIYDCSVGSAKRTLECYQFKFIAEDIDEVKEVEKWITDIQ